MIGSTFWNRSMVNSKIGSKIGMFLLCGKAEYTAYPEFIRLWRVAKSLR